MPKNPAHSRTEVPLLRKEIYEGPFQSYHARNGWGNDRILKHDLSGEEIEDLKSLLQTWLFFGLLEEILGDLMKPSDWVREGSDGLDVISTAHLRSLLVDLHKSQELLPSATQQTRREHIDKCLKIAIDTVNSLSIQNSPLIESNEVLSIAFLCDLIEKSFGTEKEAYRASGSLHLGVSRPLQTKMLTHGWCKNDVHRLAHQLDLSSLYLASNLDRPEREVCHKDCTTRLCITSQIDEKKYVTRHDARNCDGNCEYIGVSQSELLYILRSGVIPLIYYDAKNAPNSIKLVPAIPGTSYVAISHVWSHGLGNPHDNSLPQCQICRISILVNKLPSQSESSPTLFWLDTICFPVHSAEAANIALISMRKTYAEADRVLVIDRYLEAVESKPLLRTECLMRILCSSWTRRLWTLQEGALAKSLYFRFADDAIELEKAAFLMTAEMTFVTNDHSLEYQPIFSMVSELWEVWRTAESELPRIVLNYLSGGLRWRATSVASDEALCLATLAGLDMEIIAQATPENRMTKFWSLLPSISAQIVFWSGSKINHKGFRWAPATFLGESEAIFQDFANKSFSEVDDRSSTTRTDSGLIFRSAGILLNAWRANIGRNFWIRDQNRSWYHVHRQGIASLEPRDDKDPEMTRTLVLIMKNALKQSFAGPSPERSITCIIASIYNVDEENDIVYVNMEDIAFMTAHGDIESVSITAPLVARLVADSERRLLLLDSSVASHSAKASPEHQHPPEEEVTLPIEGESGVQENMSEMTEEADMTILPVKAGEAPSTSEDLDPARVKARDEDGRLSIDLKGEHYVFDCVELSEDQTWCLD